MSFESHSNRKKKSHIEEATTSLFNVCKPSSKKVLAQQPCIIGGSNLDTFIHDAKQSGCRLEYACHEVQIDLRAYRRWYKQGEIQADQRPTCVRPEPASKRL